MVAKTLFITLYFISAPHVHKSDLSDESEKSLAEFMTIVAL